jgi:hypothetical protein
MRKKTCVQAMENDLMVHLTFHNVSESLLSEFAKQIVAPYYNGNLSGAIQDLMQRALHEQEFVHSHIVAIRSSVEA